MIAVINSMERSASSTRFKKVTFAIIVTGEAGFIGSNIVKSLNNTGYRNIFVADNLKKDGIKFFNLLDLDITDYMDKKDFIANIIVGDDLGDIDAFSMKVRALPLRSGTAST